MAGNGKTRIFAGAANTKLKFPRPKVRFVMNFTRGNAAKEA